MIKEYSYSFRHLLVELGLQVADQVSTLMIDKTVIKALFGNIPIAPIVRAGGERFMASPYEIPLNLPLQKGDFKEAEPRGISVPGQIEKARNGVKEGLS